MINIQNLTFGYSGSKRNVFSQFNLQMKPGSVYGLLGKNGTGKTTLLYLLCGLLRPNKGEITIDGDVVSEMKKQMLEKIYLVPEEFMLPSMSMSDYVKMYKPFYKNFSQEILDSCLREFELEGDLKLSSLSMGTKKKVLMSFALATNTKLLLMDEPSNGLDIPSKRQFRKVIASNMNEERLMVISTHQVHDVEMLIDHVTLIGQEKLLLDSSMQELAEQYTFGTNPEGEVLYSEKTIDGTQCIARRTANEPETPVNLEMLFEYITSLK